MTRDDLREIIRLEQRIKDKESLIIYLRSLATRHTLPIGDKVQSGSINDPMKPIDKAVDLEEEIREDICDLFQLKFEAYRWMSTLEGEEKRLMELRYIRGLSWREVAEHMSYSERRVYQLHSEVMKREFS